MKMGWGKTDLARGLLKPWVDSDATWPILWYRVPDSNLPGPATIFTDRSWDEKEHWYATPGMAYRSLTYQAGPPPPAHNGPACGDPSLYVNGLSYATWAAGGYADTCSCPLAWQDLAGCACAAGTIQATFGYPAQGCTCIDSRLTVSPGYPAAGCACITGQLAYPLGCVCAGGQLANVQGCACVGGQLANVQGCACISAWVPNTTGCACISGTITQGGGGGGLACSTTGQPSSLTMDVTPSMSGAAGPFTLTLTAGNWGRSGPVGTQASAVIVLSCAAPSPWQLSVAGFGASYLANADSGTGSAPIDTFWHNADLSGFGGSATSTIHIHT